MSTILIVEDDPTLNANIRQALEATGWQVDTAYDGQLAARMLKKTKFDLVVMDINLPGINGYQLCKEFRTYNTETPVIMLTAFSELDDKVQGFEVGADDYLTKPFFMRELLVRIQVQLKRRKQLRNEEYGDQLIVGDIRIHLPGKKVFRQSQEITLTPREYQILVLLAEKNGELVSKKDLLDEIWGNSVDTNTNTIEVYINFLRNKIDKPFGKNSIKTKVGYGYYLDTNEHN